MSWSAYVWPDGRIDTVIDHDAQGGTLPVRPRGCALVALSGPPLGIAPFRQVGTEAVGDLAGARERAIQVKVAEIRAARETAQYEADRAVAELEVER
jgi:hypothetical protein